MPSPQKLLDQTCPEPVEGLAEWPYREIIQATRAAIQVKHYSPRTAEAYVGWIRHYILFHGKRHPLEMGIPEIESFLTHLVVDQNVAASTQNQALCALLFLYREVLKKDVTGPIDAVRATKPSRLPTVLTRIEVPRVIEPLSGTHRLVVELLYGSGLRVNECLQLRIKDIDFARHQIVVRQGKGMKDRVTLLPHTLIPSLQEHLRHVKQTHDDDLSKGYGSVALPFALARKYPNADRKWKWQYVFLRTACPGTHKTA